MCMKIQQSLKNIKEKSETYSSWIYMSWQLSNLKHVYASLDLDLVGTTLEPTLPLIELNSDWAQTWSQVTHNVRKSSDIWENYQGEGIVFVVWLWILIQTKKV